MILQRHMRWLFAFALIAVFSVSESRDLLAQSKNGFAKSGRGVGRSSGPPNVASRGRGQNQNHGNSYGNRGNQRGYGHNKGGYRYIPQGRIGAGHRGSLNHFHGVYLPISPYGNFGFNQFGVNQFGVNQFGINRFGVNNFGVNNFGLAQPYYPVIPQMSTFGANSFGYNLNPAYSTYGSFLNSGLPNQNVLGSSVAGQALLQAQNQQSTFPGAPNQGTDQQLELMRLQLELERARQQLAAAGQQIPAQQTQRSLKVPTAEQDQRNAQAIEQLGLAAVLESNELASASQLKAERAFRGGEYGQAARFAGLATSLDESNGKILLFRSQAHFANGEYGEAFDALSKSRSLLPAEQLGWVVQNFKLFYGKNDFVSQMKRLSSHLESSPNDANAWLLRGFQYGALGYSDAAKQDLNRAKNVGADRELVDVLLTTFAGDGVGN